VCVVQCPQVLGEVVDKCLTGASDKRYTSLVFPALGTGQLRYPSEEMAQVMLETIDGFQKSHPSTTLRDIRIVIYHLDSSNIKAFKETLGKFTTSAKPAG
jgi:poly [ADP-ribose] polymerase 10/14/15